MDKHEDIPAFVDYDGSEDVEPEKWTASNVESFWQGTLVRKRKISSPSWSIKYKALAKRLLSEFEPKDVRSMINYWIESESTERAPVFELLFMNRYKIHDKARPKDYSEWEL